MSMMAMKSYLSPADVKTARLKNKVWAVPLPATEPVQSVDVGLKHVEVWVYDASFKGLQKVGE